MVRMLMYFFVSIFYGLLISGEIKNIPDKVVPQTIRNLKELSANFQPLLTPTQDSPNRKNIIQALQGYNNQEIQKMLDIASAQ